MKTAKPHVTHQVLYYREKRIYTSRLDAIAQIMSHRARVRRLKRVKTNCTQGLPKYRNRLSIHRNLKLGTSTHQDVEKDTHIVENVHHKLENVRDQYDDATASGQGS